MYKKISFSIITYFLSYYKQSKFYFCAHDINDYDNCWGISFEPYIFAYTEVGLFEKISKVIDEEWTNVTETFFKTMFNINLILM